MGLTRLRAEQISDIDYKQAVRVITVANVTLSGGAPTPVDGVNLSAGDRVLVTGQSTGSQNGIYQVQTVGTGSNGTWIRSLDTNATGELEAGTIVMVTEGTVFADTQWKLTTNNPIVIGTTALTFEQNSAYAFGNIFANGTAVLANSVGSTVTFTAGDNIAITGNNTSKTVTIAVTGVSTANISNGTSNVTVVSSGGNVTVGVAGSGNIAEFSTTGVRITGNVNPAANVIYDLGNTTNRWKDLYLSNSSIYLGNVVLAATATTLTVDGVPVVTSTANAISVTGNITGGNLLTAGLISATGTITSAANITGGNLLTAGLISATGTITSAANITGGNVLTGGVVSATANVTGGNVLTGGVVSATANVTGGNIRTAGVVSATGNGVFSGGTLLVGASYTSFPSSTRGIVTINGTADQILEFANGSVNFGYLYHSGTDISLLNARNGAIQFATNSSTRLFITSTGIVSAVGNIQGANLRTTGLVTATGNVQGGNISTAGLITATGNIQGGNIRTAGLISATGAVTGAAITGTSLTVTTGNITAGNLLLSGAIIDSAQLDIQTSAANANIALTPNGTGIVTVSTQLSAVGNVTGGNISTAGVVTATANIIGGNVLTGGVVSATANVTGGNILTAGLITATGNISGNFFLGNGSLLTGISAGSIANGTSNVTVVSSGGNVTVGIGGYSNVAIFGINTLSLSGPFATPKTINSNVSVSGSINAVLVSPVTVDSLGNIFVPDSSTLTIFTPT